MTFKELKQKIKEEQKELAQIISRGKYLRKPCRRTDVTEEDKKLYYLVGMYCPWKVEELRYNFRHRHITYCRLFNKTPHSSIEKPREDNLPSNNLIEKFKNEWLGKLDEALCNYA
jgi:hypothetical protein